MQGPEDSSSWVALSLDKEAWDDTELVSAYNKAIKYYNEKHGAGKEELASASSPSLVPTRTTRLTPNNKKRRTSQRKPTSSSVPSSPLAPQPKETNQIQPSPSPSSAASSSSSSVDSSLTNAATDSSDTAAWQQQYNSGFCYYPSSTSSAHSHHQLTPPSISTSTMPPVSSLSPSFPPFPIPSFPCNTPTTNERAGGEGGMRLDSQELGSLLMAWYYCGYFTGRYQTLREAASYLPQPLAPTHSNVTAAPSTTTTTITSTGSKKRPFPSPSSDADHHP
ncbi:PUM-HD domain-containing protein [Balamuthia mandrillaris]